MAVTTSAFVALSGVMVIFRSPVAVGTTPEVGPVCGVGVGEGGAGAATLGGRAPGVGCWPTARTSSWACAVRTFTGSSARGLSLDRHESVRARAANAHPISQSVKEQRHLVAPSYNDERVATRVGDDSEHLLGSSHRCCSRDPWGRDATCRHVAAQRPLPLTPPAWPQRLPSPAVPDRSLKRTSR